MAAGFLWVWAEPSASLAFIDGAASNEMNQLERDMLATFVQRGRHDLASAFMKRQKYARAVRCKITPEYLWLRREAFLGTEGAGAKPQTDEEWVRMARERYGHNEGFRRYEAGLAARNGAHAAAALKSARNPSDEQHEGQSCMP